MVTDAEKLKWAHDEIIQLREELEMHSKVNGETRRKLSLAAKELSKLIGEIDV